MPGNSIKLLAEAVFERNKCLDTPHAPPLKLVPKAITQGELPKTKQPSPDWSAEDWHAYFYERAGILEYDGHLPRPEAERRAYGMTLAKWMDAHRPPSDKLDICAHCHSDRPGAVIIPCLSAFGGHYGVHDKCLPDLLEEMRQRGIEALSLSGLSPSLTEEKRP